MKKHHKSLIPKIFGVAAITFGRHVFFRDKKEKVSDILIRHEAEHVKQYEKHGFIVFLVKYIFEYAKGLFKYKSHQKAYWNNRFEVKAREAEKI